VIDIERILAPNPSLYTGPGTNTYLLRSRDEVIVVDPGPIIASHAANITAAVAGATVVGVIATHTHPDHAPMANPLASALGAPVMGFAEGPGFRPDVFLRDGDDVACGDLVIRAIHTPGHTPDHLCFLDRDTLLTGDHIMGGSTVIIEDAAAYLDSLYRVRDLGVRRIEPGHGDAMDDAGRVVTQYIEHRLEREREIVAAVVGGATTVGELVDLVYAAVPMGLRPAATHQVRVQLIKLSGDGSVWFDDDGTESGQVRAR